MSPRQVKLETSLRQDKTNLILVQDKSSFGLLQDMLSFRLVQENSNLNCFFSLKKAFHSDFPTNKQLLNYFKMYKSH